MGGTSSGSNLIMKGLTEDLVQACSKENLWEDLDRLEIDIIGDQKITDEGLKLFASKLGPRLSNVQDLKLYLYCWKLVTDSGLRELACQLNLSNIRSFHLDLRDWSKITDEGLKVLVAQLAPQLTNVHEFQLIMRDL